MTLSEVSACLKTLLSFVVKRAEQPASVIPFGRERQYRELVITLPLQQPRQWARPSCEETHVQKEPKVFRGLRGRIGARTSAVPHGSRGHSQESRRNLFPKTQSRVPAGITSPVLKSQPHLHDRINHSGGTLSSF